GLTGIGTDPPFAIGQRALLLRTPAGNLLWDPPGFVDGRCLEAVRDAGGLRAVSASHPHFYGAIVEWSHAFDAEVLLPEADAAWSRRCRPTGSAATTAAGGSRCWATTARAGRSPSPSATSSGYAARWQSGDGGAAARGVGGGIPTVPMVPGCWHP